MTRRVLPFLLLLLVHLLVFLPQATAHQTRAFRTLSQENLLGLLDLDPPEWANINEGHLKKLLIPRASGSENNGTSRPSSAPSIGTKKRPVVNVPLNETLTSGRPHQTTFTASTPIGDVEFTNLIYTFDPTAPRKVVLSAHFDSKWFPTFPANQFIGATDSAAPCAMLLDLAEALTPLLAARRERIDVGEGILVDGYDEEESSETTLQIVFFDGEEAFHDWTATDSIYGSRRVLLTVLPPPDPSTSIAKAGIADRSPWQTSRRPLGRDVPPAFASPLETAVLPRADRPQHDRSPCPPRPDRERKLQDSLVLPRNRLASFADGLCGRTAAKGQPRSGVRVVLE
ncbi:glutaminyl-peptide cyclotransferase, partial [Tremellales sp. Uapishka_1]